MNVLIATLGGSWQVIPEILGFTNPEQIPLYRGGSLQTQLRRRREEHGIGAVDKVWAVTTAKGAETNAPPLADWIGRLPAPALRLYWPEGMADIQSAEDARIMAELIHRLVFEARERAGDGQVLLSLAGGRKTMSADLQRAGQTLGCHALLHVIDLKNPRDLDLRPADFAAPLPEPARDAFLPLVVDGRQPGSEAVRLEWERLRPLARLPAEGAVRPATLEGSILEELERIQRQGDALLVNYRLQTSGEEPRGNFRALYALPPSRIADLRDRRIGHDGHCKEADLAWLRKLPKAELHCHLGGILNPAEMIEVASAEARRVTRHLRDDPAMSQDLTRLQRWIKAGDTKAILDDLGNGGFRGLRKRWCVPESLGVCAFLLAFSDHIHLLEQVIYGPLLDPIQFCGIGIEAYERLGDLQGSGLLQSKATLRKALEILQRQCRVHSIDYLELRCSPLNYTRGGLKGHQVVSVLMDALHNSDCDIRLIFIASRHGDPQRLRQHIALARCLLDRDPRFPSRFVGFDLAGAEHLGKPSQFRDDFRAVHERVIRITIHAGEGEPVANIWEAIYELNADRIGHGLTLEQDRQLLARLRDRGVAVEMCPSSNFQIVGFRDFLSDNHPGKIYPLADYLEQGLQVTINTDDPGISRTGLTQEFYKAAALCPEGLTYWQILQMVRNSFRAAFCDRQDRWHHLRKAEQTILRQLLRD